MDLTFETHTQDPWTVLAIEGELDLHTSPQLREAIIEIVDAEGTRIDKVFLIVGDVGEPRGSGSLGGDR